ncbi:MAG TPA: hypothetical protein VJ438_04675 [Candidatus Nanoarchaeia archaeon]|nr:hypothetical protein [Candidatus Nanoarchaeia archaeon]
MSEEKTETPEEIVRDIEETGVPGKVAVAEEKIDEKEEEKFDEKAAEKESLKTETSIEEKKKKILEKAKKLKEKVLTTSTADLKEQIKAKKRAEMLVPLEEYVKSGIYLGTKVVTPDMKPFVYRRRADGLAIFNTDLIDEKLKEGIEFLSKFDAKDIIVVCKRQAGWKVVDMFSRLTGIRAFTKKYPAGILTNITLPNFFENELTIITDHWLDKNAMDDTLKIKKKVLMLCDTNNFSKGTNQIIIGNNKSSRSLGLIFYLLTKGYCNAKGIDCEIPELEWWTSEGDETRATAEFGV